MRTKSKGFTLVELMVVIAVMAVIATMALPSFSTLINKQNLSKSSRELSTILSQARSKAAIERRMVTVQLNSKAANTDNQLNWSPTGGATLSGATASIVFQPNGLVQNATSDTTFKICDSATDAKYATTISISRMGTIQRPVEGAC